MRFPTRFIANRLVSPVLALVSLVPATPAAVKSWGQEQSALDQIMLAPAVRKSTEETWETRTQTVLSGKIKQLDGSQLVLTGADGRDSTIPSDRVESVRFEWPTHEAAQAMQTFESRKYQEAIDAIENSYRTGVPRWQQRFMISALVRAADALNNPRTAGILFLNLAASSPPDMLYGDMPLCWTVRESNKPLLEKAREWLASDDEAAKLLGASWLLFEAEGSQASAALKELQSSENAAVAAMAVAQSWRLVPPPKSLEQLSGWVAFRDSLIVPLQLGPTEFLADRLMRIGETELAVGQLVRIASQHGDRYHRAANALKTAESILKREGRNDEAERLGGWIERLEAK